MKKLLVLTTFIFLFSTSLLSQNFWEGVTLPEPDMMVSLLSVNNSGTLFLGTGDYRFFYSDNNGDNWTESGNWPNTYEAKCIDYNSLGDLFVGTTSDGMLKSTDGGATFIEINNGLSNYNIWDIDINDNDNIIIGNPEGVFRSINNGDLWEALGTGLPGDIETVGYGSNNRIYAGTFGSGMWRSDDNGTTWVSINNGLPESAMITALEVVPDLEIFAGVYPDGLFHSIDYGDSWVPYNNGLPFGTQQIPQRDYSISSIVSIWLFIYVAIYNYGAYLLMRSLDVNNLAMDNYLWILQDAGLPAGPTVSIMAGGGPENKLFLGTYDQGLYRNAYPVIIEKIETLEAGYKQGKISPNPIVSTTSFTFSVPETSFVSIKIYNLAGQEIETVLNNKYLKGTYSVNWSPQLLQGGLYFCKMETDNFSTTKKIIYLK